MVRVLPSSHASVVTPPPNVPICSPERLTWLGVLPVAATAFYYALPSTWQVVTAVQFAPQLLAYLALALWARANLGSVERLGLAPALIPQGLRWGLVTGLILGGLNVAVILWLTPWLGGDILFLRKTPHAQVPTAIMLPWVILLIALGIEINFRGFLLGRLFALFASRMPDRYARIQAGLAVGISALTFAFDPFMVMTFKHLHWIAVWDGVVWGILWVHLRNLYVPIVAHALEVIVMYSILKTTLA